MYITRIEAPHQPEIQPGSGISVIVINGQGGANITLKSFSRGLKSNLCLRLLMKENLNSVVKQLRTKGIT